ncbi:MAG: XTP/dITP diphosphatase [Peptococcaceae bacterium]|nr:XTP/dITP diphosphatase [Peptococcaceae bacterium]
MKILLATQNQGKVQELKALLADEGVEILSTQDFATWPEIEENGKNFAENAMLKAREGMRRSGLICLADDSGLEVDALDGAPGILSARFAGEPKDDERNIDKLLEQLDHVSDEQRTARFRCALAVVTPHADDHEYVTEGTLEGKIIRQRRGKEGFGYDPVFLVEDFGRTLAEMTAAQKNRISHRAQALRNAVPLLKEVVKRYQEKGKS